ncbi:hypothetical protein [Halobacillus naozhouensis]|uniref:Uncharacterized protein n=1 Tax=Halobacillus naozhouensis TaxID=554880 RepID=A0ABY8J2L1_9BACI|nr:hypothetical protein [Halobacillus naozhouensis]WFT74990.1 hypothetical protein P9989_00805 [Halobacillus naozhouensis]
MEVRMPGHQFVLFIHTPRQEIKRSLAPAVYGITYSIYTTFLII